MSKETNMAEDTWGDLPVLLPPGVITTDAKCAELGVTVKTLRAMAKRGEIAWPAGRAPASGVRGAVYWWPGR